MKAHTASLLNAIILIGLGLWGYFGSQSPSMTALIPVIFGAIILAMNKGIKNENKVIAHVAVVLTLLILIGLIKPLSGAMDRGDTMATARVAVMILSTLVALGYFIKSFIDARRQKVEN